MTGRPSGLCILALLNWKPSRNSLSYCFFSSGFIGFHCSEERQYEMCQHSRLNVSLRLRVGDQTLYSYAECPHRIFFLVFCHLKKKYFTPREGFQSTPLLLYHSSEQFQNDAGVVSVTLFQAAGDRAKKITSLVNEKMEALLSSPRCTDNLSQKNENTRQKSPLVRADTE